MTHAILVPNQIAAMNVDAYNRPAVAGSSVNLDNGNVFRLDSKSTVTGYGEVWNVTAPTTSASTMNNLWMAYSPEVVLTDSRYKGIDPDPRNFYNSGSQVFDAYKPQVGDIITLTGDALTGTAELAYANSATGVYTLAWGAAVVADSLTYRYLNTTYISIGTGAMDTQRVVAYQFECIAN